MKPRHLLLPCLLLCLAACQRTPEPVAPAQDQAAVHADAVVAGDDQPREDVPPATAPPGTLPPRLQQGGQALARLDGYGDVALGMSADQVRQHWGGELHGGPAPGSEAAGCYYLLPKWADNAREFGFMIEGDRLVRYDSGNPKELAPGGGRVGMSVEEISRLYPGVETQPHKYLEGARTLRVAGAGATSTLVFETDASGRVVAWRVGTPPAVDYVEGCG